MQPPFYTNGRNGGSTPELNRPIQTPNSDDNRSDPEQRPGPQSNTVSEPHMDSRHTVTKPRKQGMLGRSKSIKIDDTSSGRTKLNKQPPKLSPDPSSAWAVREDGVPLKTAPLDKGQSLSLIHI